MGQQLRETCFGAVSVQGFANVCWDTAWANPNLNCFRLLGIKYGIVWRSFNATGLFEGLGFCLVGHTQLPLRGQFARTGCCLTLSIPR